MDAQDPTRATDPQALMLEDRSIVDFLEHLALLGEKLFSEDAGSDASSNASGEGSVVCGLMSRRGNAKAVMTSSSPLAAKLNEAHDLTGEGPALQALTMTDRVVVEDAREDPRWPAYFGVAVSLGSRASLSVPLQVGAEGIGALSFYARSEGFFTADKQRIAVVFAEQASKALEMAMRVARHQDATENVRSALGSRTAIDVAVGIIIGQNRCTQAEAFNILRNASNTRNIKVHDIAEQLILQASGANSTTHFTN